MAQGTVEARTCLHVLCICSSAVLSRADRLTAACQADSSTVRYPVSKEQGGRVAEQDPQRPPLPSVLFLGWMVKLRHHPA